MPTVALILGTVLLITACGTKGPLTMPPKPTAATATIDASTKAEPGR